MFYKNKYVTLKINKNTDIFRRLHDVLVRLENKRFVSKLFACDKFAQHACEQEHVHPFVCDPFCSYLWPCLQQWVNERVKTTVRLQRVLNSAPRLAQNRSIQTLQSRSHIRNTAPLLSEPLASLIITTWFFVDLYKRRCRLFKKKERSLNTEEIPTRFPLIVSE